MIKRVILSLALFGISFIGTSQVNPHVLGIRGGSGTYGNGAELSYQMGFGSSNRLELDLGWSRHYNNKYHNQSFGISAIYHWVWNITSGLNWFVGPGGQVGFYENYYNHDHDGITIALGGQIGIEFDFSELGAPIQLSIDTRPMFGFVGGGGNGFGYGGALGIRYVF